MATPKNHTTPFLRCLLACLCLLAHTNAWSHHRGSAQLKSTHASSDQATYRVEWTPAAQDDGCSSKGSRCDYVYNLEILSDHGNWDTLSSKRKLHYEGEFRKDSVLRLRVWALPRSKSSVEAFEACSSGTGDEDCVSIVDASYFSSPDPTSNDPWAAPLQWELMADDECDGVVACEFLYLVEQTDSSGSWQTVFVDNGLEATLELSNPKLLTAVRVFATLVDAATESEHGKATKEQEDLTSRTCADEHGNFDPVALSGCAVVAVHNFEWVRPESADSDDEDDGGVLGSFAIAPEPEEAQKQESTGFKKYAALVWVLVGVVCAIVLAACVIRFEKAKKMHEMWGSRYDPRRRRKVKSVTWDPADKQISKLPREQEHDLKAKKRHDKYDEESSSADSDEEQDSVRRKNPNNGNNNKKKSGGCCS